MRGEALQKIIVVVPGVDEGPAVCTMALGAGVASSGARELRPQSMFVVTPLVRTLHERTTWTETWSPLVAESACACAPPAKMATDIQPPIRPSRFMTVRVDARSISSRDQCASAQVDQSIARSVSIMTTAGARVVQFSVPESRTDVLGAPDHLTYSR